MHMLEELVANPIRITSLTRLDRSTSKIGGPDLRGYQRLFNAVRVADKAESSGEYIKRGQLCMYL